MDLARNTLLGLALALAAAPAAHAQPEANAEARSLELREAGRERLRQGQLAEAFGFFREATLLTADPSVWVELGEVADRLRLDEIALQAYQTYLERRRDAPDRAEIEGRVRVLLELAAGQRYTLTPNSTIPERRPAVEPASWTTTAVETRRHNDLIVLDFGARASPPPVIRRRPDLLPLPALESLSLARRLSRP